MGATPSLADLPAACLRLYKPPFFSTGVDYFGLNIVKVGRYIENDGG